MKITRFLACAAARAVALASVAMLPAASAGAQIAVIDASNHAQNLLQAARALEQISNQVRSLENEAEMLRSMGRNLERVDFPELGQVTGALREVEALMAEAEGIDFSVDRIDAQFRHLFPGVAADAAASDGRIARARARLDRALAGFRHSMTVQARVVENIAADRALLAELARRSSGAVGGLQAQQATNQLLALGTKQQLQLQALLAAEHRSLGLERARRAQAEIEARAATRRFLGTGKAYSPR